MNQECCEEDLKIHESQTIQEDIIEEKDEESMVQELESSGNQQQTVPMIDVNSFISTKKEADSATVHQELPVIEKDEPLTVEHLEEEKE